MTGACLMTRREVFEGLGGFAAELPVNYNDVDYCLKAHAGGRRVVYDPDVELIHFESSSRSSDVEDWEKEWLRQRWRGVTEPDPYSNPSLKRGEPRLGAMLRSALRQALPARRG